MLSGPEFQRLYFFFIFNVMSWPVSGDFSHHRIPPAKHANSVEVVEYPAGPSGRHLNRKLYLRTIIMWKSRGQVTWSWNNEQRLMGSQVLKSSSWNITSSVLWFVGSAVFRRDTVDVRMIWISYSNTVWSCVMMTDGASTSSNIYNQMTDLQPQLW